MARFYLNAPLSVGQTIDLPPDIIRHLQVLRIREHEVIQLFNGNGSEYEATLSNLNKKQAAALVIKKNEQWSQTSQNKISLAIGLIANDKMDLVIQKATELGVKEIIPLYSKYAQRISSERLNKRMEHWQSIIISSCMQCGQNYIPTICMPILYEELLNDTGKYNLKLILSPREVDAANPQKRHEQEVGLDWDVTKSLDITHALLMVGAEGGWSNLEVTEAIKQGFIPVKLGELILRAETAVIAGISLLNVKLKIW